MTALNKQALRSREEFEEYYNETHAVKVTSQFKRFGYYVSPTMQKAWELWQKAQSSMQDELKSVENNLIDSECHVAELEEALRDKQALLEAAEKRIAELEARSIGEHDLFLRAKALMYQSGGAPVEKSLNPVDAWLFDAEQATTKAPVLPPLNDDLVSILGRPNFMCSQFAEFLRMDGMEIRRKSEHEQAAVIHWFMNLYLQHGAGWCNVARAELERINRAAGIGVKGE
ncbi:tektin family protein [Citrobacter sp. LUTT5]|uniref:tektin family protein n=1 Tax=Citrobacter sp. LUTT5 TaxID=2697370 RepID=UPI001F37C449|nr:tektin family protein [Citrobacter sp. LUTT5]